MNKNTNNSQDFFIQNFVDLSKTIRENLPKYDMEDWQKESLKLIADIIDKTTCKNIYKVHPPKKLAIWLRKDALKFLELYNEYYHTSVDYTKEDITLINFDDKVSRMFLGIACERILQSAFLLNGYCIHSINGKRSIMKFKDIPKPDFISGKTIKFWDLIENINLILPNQEKENIDFIKRCLGVARYWRNSDIHLGVRYIGMIPPQYIVTCFDHINLIVEQLLKKKRVVS